MLKTLKDLPVCTVLALGLVLLPALLFYAALFSLSYNLPYTDDYHAILVPVTRLHQMAGLGNRLRYFFEAQHNEYKLWLDMGVAWAQAALFGRLSFRILSLVGDSVVLGLGLLLWKLFPLRQQPLAKRLLWFAPASWLLFQLSYAETLDWSMAGLQNLCVLLFSFLSLALLPRLRGSSFAAAVLCLALAVASSGNGLLVPAIGALALTIQRKYARLACWLTAGMLLLVAYGFHFDVHSSQVAPHRNILVTLRHFSIAYTLAMMGSEGALRGSIVLGVVLCICNLYLLLTGHFRRHPALGYCTLFLMLTAVGVGGIRSEFGLAQAISSRYHLYCLLLLIFVWFALAERLTSAYRPRLAQTVLAVALLFSVLFALRRDLWGVHFLASRKAYSESGMQAYRRSLVQGGDLGPVFWTPEPNPLFQQLNPAARAALAQADAAGLYTPPR